MNQLFSVAYRNWDDTDSVRLLHLIPIDLFQGTSLCVDKLNRGGRLRGLGDFPQVSCFCLWLCSLWSGFIVTPTAWRERTTLPAQWWTGWKQVFSLSGRLSHFSSPPALMPCCLQVSLSSFPHWDSILSVVCSRSPNRIYDSLTQIMFPLTISEEILFHSGLLNLQETYITPWNSPSPIRPTKEHITYYLLRSPWWRTYWSWQFTESVQKVMRKQDR